ncbi:MAG TPA: hypothetical protein VJ453_02820 [Terriglobales bacterium]|jgi:hypothetical protein|nr:hypothetical protein [Terriglobales bacterium]
MKALFWIGLIALIAGIALLLVRIPRSERHGIKSGDVSIGVETRSQEKVSPVVSAVIIAAGAGLMIAGRSRAS